MAYTLPLAQFLATAQKHPNSSYLHQPINRELLTFTWSETEKQARSIAQALLNTGLQTGDKVAIASKNCAQWFITDLAIMMAGLVSIPVYPTANKDTVAYIIKHSGCKALFLGKLDDPEEIAAGVPDDLDCIAYPYYKGAAQHQWEQWLETSPLQDLHQPSEDETLSIVYTSGSTGNPKGVVLSHGNFAAAASDSFECLSASHDDAIMSYLPLAHITERSLVEMASFYVGGKIYFVESLDTFIADVTAGQPNLFVSVPRLWSKFQAEILQKMPDNKLQILLKIPGINTLVKKKIKKGLGLTQARLFGSGSAPISPAILNWYLKLDIPISEGWGMTETSGMSCVNLPFEKSAIGSIGKPLASIKMRISEKQEIEISGPAVFKTYYNNDEATAESFTEDGWFKTGDMGLCTEAGHYFIIGRIKEQFKTAKGKYVAPAPIEGLLGKNTDIEQACVIGQGRKQAIALLVMNEGFEQQTAAIKDKLNKTLVEVNAQLESHEKLDHLIVLNESWTIENSLLTPTLKIKRQAIEEKYKDLLEASFDDSVVWL